MATAALLAAPSRWSGGYDLQLHLRALAGDGQPRPFGAPLHVEVRDDEQTFAELGS